MSTKCWACRDQITSHQAREGEGRCRSCATNDYYEEDIFIDTIKVDCHWVRDGKYVLTFQGMTEATQDRLRDWLTANIPDMTYRREVSGEEVAFDNKEDFDLCYLAFV
jgi:hypothetical protein